MADRLADATGDLAHRVGMPSALAPLGVRADDLELLTERALADSCMLTNPRRAEPEGILDVYRQAL